MAIKDLDTLKEVTVKQFELFQDRPYAPDLLRSKAGSPRGIFNARGADWKRIRVTLTPSFSASKMKVVMEHVNIALFHTILYNMLFRANKC